MQVVKTKSGSFKTSAKPPKLKDCPYCKSDLTATERDFFPCSCTFQACANCYEDIMHKKGLCPNCHKPLRVSKVKALHVSKKEELQKSEIEKLGKEKTQKKCTVVTTVVTTVSSKHSNASGSTQTIRTEPRAQLPKMSFGELSKLRIIQRNLIYVIGLAPQVAKQEILDKAEYFGQYGKISKIVVNKGNAYNSSSPNGPSFSAYITFAKEIDASVAILAADQFVLYDRTLRTSYGTTKYCTFLLKGQSCPNPDCLYLHSVENREELLIKDEMITNKEIFMDQQKLTLDFIEKHYEEVMKKATGDAKLKTVLPSLATVQAKASRLIDQRIREKRERERDTETLSKYKEKENLDINTDSVHSSAKKSLPISNQDVGSACDSLSPQKTRKESKIEGDSEAGLHPHSRRSSSSNWSTTDNSLKKDIMNDHKEDLEIKSNLPEQLEQKESEDMANHLSQEAIEELPQEEKPKNIFVEMIEANTLSNKEKNKNEEVAYKDSFDKNIFERVTNNIFNAQTSRFQNTQDSSEEDTASTTHSKNNENDEFNGISKSIVEFIETKAESSESAPESAQIAVGKDETENFPNRKANSQNKTGGVISEEQSKGLVTKAKSDKAKITQKGSENDIISNKIAQENTYGPFSATVKSHGQKQTENNNSCQNNDNINNSNGMQNKRNGYNKQVDQKFSSFK